MRDLSKPYRLAVAAALQGNITVNLYDAKKWVTATDTLYGVFSTQQQTPNAEYTTDCTWAQNCSIDIEIFDKTGSEVTKDNVDNVANLIGGILVPAPGVTNITSSNIQFTLASLEFLTRDLSISETESILVKVVRFSCVLIEQS